jgi:hypothetical protein
MRMQSRQQHPRGRQLQQSSRPWQQQQTQQQPNRSSPCRHKTSSSYSSSWQQLLLHMSSSSRRSLGCQRQQQVRSRAVHSWLLLRLLPLLLLHVLRRLRLPLLLQKLAGLMRRCRGRRH